MRCYFILRPKTHQTALPLLNGMHKSAHKNIQALAFLLAQLLCDGVVNVVAWMDIVQCVPYRGRLGGFYRGTINGSPDNFLEFGA